MHRLKLPPREVMTIPYDFPSLVLFLEAFYSDEFGRDDGFEEQDRFVEIEMETAFVDSRVDYYPCAEKNGK
jgi:hypothetical protein